jgi:hypothetical protein
MPAHPSLVRGLGRVDGLHSHTQSGCVPRACLGLFRGRANGIAAVQRELGRGTPLPRMRFPPQVPGGATGVCGVWVAEALRCNVLPHVAVGGCGFHLRCLGRGGAWHCLGPLSVSGCVDAPLPCVPSVGHQPCCEHRVQFCQVPLVCMHLAVLRRSWAQGRQGVSVCVGVEMGLAVLCAVCVLCCCCFCSGTRRLTSCGTVESCAETRTRRRR